MLSSLNEILTGTERVLDTPLPAAYSIAISQISWVYVMLLPFQLYNFLHWTTIPASIGTQACPPTASIKSWTKKKTLITNHAQFQLPHTSSSAYSSSAVRLRIPSVRMSTIYRSRHIVAKLRRSSISLQLLHLRMSKSLCAARKIWFYSPSVRMDILHGGTGLRRIFVLLCVPSLSPIQPLWMSRIFPP